jgi:uncharacterized membrane protein YvlD (DUF360 family)
MDRAARISVRFLLVWALEALSLVVMTRIVPGIGLLTRDAWSAFANAMTAALILALINTLDVFAVLDAMRGAVNSTSARRR